MKVVVFTQDNFAYAAVKKVVTFAALTMCATYGWANKVESLEEFTKPLDKKTFLPSTVQGSKTDGITISTPTADLAWLAEFYEASIDAHSAADIYPLISGIAKVFKQKDYTSVDNILSTAPLNSLSVTAMVTLVRTTYPARSKLQEWDNSLHAIREKLISLGENSNSLLRGLA